MSAWPIFEPQVSAEALAPHPHRIQLVNDRTPLAFPPLCPNCGRPATDRLTIEKVFRTVRTDGVPDALHVEAASVPFCAECIARHRAERQALAPWQRLAVSLADGLSITGVGLCFLSCLFLPGALRDLARPGFPWLLLSVLGLLSVAWLSFKAAWDKNAHRRVPPQTDVTRAFDFGAGGAELFDTPRVTYSIRNAGFATAFAELNDHRVWHPDSPDARANRRARTWLVRAIIAGAVIVCLGALFS